MALTDTLDDLITERRIEPQLAIKILANFDRSITEVLAEKVKAKLTFKVRLTGVCATGMLRSHPGLQLPASTGPSRHIPLLRRGVDVPD